MTSRGTPKRSAAGIRKARASAKKRAKPDIVTRRELAARLDVHMMTITKWEREGMPVAQRGSKGRASHYSEVAVRAWKQMRDEAAAKPGATDLVSDRARKERAQAALAEQSFQIRMRELLPRDEVEREWSRQVAAVRTKLLAFPTTLADQLHRAAVTEGLPGVEHLLSTAVRDVLRELAAGQTPTLPAQPDPTAAGT